MQIKRRIDGEWAEINRLLERAGRRRNDVLTWSLASEDPTDFVGNLAKAIGTAWHDSWPTQLPSIAAYEHDAVALLAYEAHVRELERHFSMSAERLATVAAFVEALGDSSEADKFDWREVDRILAEAHREKVYAGRRAKLDQVRANRNNLDGFDAVVAAVLPKVPGQGEDVPTWELSRPALANHLDRGQLQLLDNFRLQLIEPWTAQLFEWADVYRVLEFAQRQIEGIAEPVARKIEWRNLYAYDDARAVLDASDSSRWKTFGRRPPVEVATTEPPSITLGWALRSPLLSLSQGTRAITLTFGFRREGFDRPAFLRALGIEPAVETPSKLRDALAAVLSIEVSTAKGWLALTLPKAEVEPELMPATLVNGGPGQDYWKVTGLKRREDHEDRPALRLRLVLDSTLPALAPGKDSGDRWPTLRVLLRQRPKHGEWTTGYAPFAPLLLAAVHVQVDVAGLVDLQLQQDDRRLDPRKPFQPFGSSPAVGSRLYLSHPELVRARLDLLRFDLKWQGLPDSLVTQYFNYPAKYQGSFTTRVQLVDRGLAISLGDKPLLTQQNNSTAPGRSIEIANVPAALANASSSFTYARQDELVASDDLRTASRYFSFELTPVDFGHSLYPGLAASQAQALAAWLSGKVTPPAGTTAANFRVDAPYTPTLQNLIVSYRSSVELEPGVDAEDRLLHIHPFGVSEIDPDDPTLFPRYDSAGELYIGIRDVAAPRKLALLLQLAEGTSNPDLEAAPVEWSYLDGDSWRPLELQFDSTRGLLNSGIVEAVLPVVEPSTRLPGDRYWLRISIARNPASVCDCVDVRAQAAMASFDDRGNAADHYSGPLPAGSVNRLRTPDVGIAAVEQPYTSFGGKPAEAAQHFHTRISERLRHKQRALTAWDYERLALRFGEIYKAKCLPAGAILDTPREPGCVDVIVIPNIRDKLPADAFAPRAPANLLADIQAYLRERAPTGAKVRVRNARFVPVRVRLGVRFVAGQDQAYAKRRLNEDLDRFLSPWAYQEGADMTIGGKLHATSIVDFVDRREYVDYVTDLKLFRHGGDGNDQVATDYPDQVLVSAREHTIDVIPELGYQQTSFTGINYMKIELDFTVG